MHSLLRGLKRSMMASNVEVVTGEDNTKKFISAWDAAVKRGLTKIGMQAERYAKEEITRQKAVDTGRLRNSITYLVRLSEKAVYVGTNVEYGKYVELGTGRQAETGGNPMILNDPPKMVHRSTDFLENHVSHYSITTKQHAEIIPEVLAKNNSNASEFTKEFVELLKKV